MKFHACKTKYLSKIKTSKIISGGRLVTLKRTKFRRLLNLVLSWKTCAKRLFHLKLLVNKAKKESNTQQNLKIWICMSQHVLGLRSKNKIRCKKYFTFQMSLNWITLRTRILFVSYLMFNAGSIMETRPFSEFSQKMRRPSLSSNSKWPKLGKWTH